RLFKLNKKENLLYEELQQQADLIQNSNDAIITIDDQFNITSWNYGAEKSLGYLRHEVMNKSILKVLKSDLTEERRSENIASLKEKGTWKGEVVQYNRNGEKLYMLLSYSAVKNADGSIKGYTSIRTDITAQKLLESKLKSENTHLELDIDKKAKEIKEIFERMKKAFIAFDRDLIVTYANETIATYIQKQKDEIIGTSLQQLFPNAQTSNFYYGCSQALQYQRTISIVEYVAYFDKWFESSIYPSDNGLSVYVSDITEKVKADEELQEKNKQLQVLSSYLQNLREDERKKIARELHDDLGQIATVLKVDVVRIRKQYLDGQTDIEQKLTTLLNTLDILISKIRKISYELRPDLLDHVGLQTALEKHCKEFEKVTGTICIFNDETKKDSRFSQEVETTIFRICQESLTNIMRHASATKVVVTISMQKDRIILSIKDNGKGFDIIEKRQSLGLIGMQERAKAISGELEIISQIDKGTTIQFSVNYKKPNIYENINS
ncbi:MAG: PAS domain-containing sensor histidine kinase, partial [Chitinophagaceae bacterium]